MPANISTLNDWYAFVPNVPRARVAALFAYYRDIMSPEEAEVELRYVLECEEMYGEFS